MYNVKNTFKDKLKVENLEKLFEEFSEKFTYPLTASEDLEHLCETMDFCIETRDPLYIGKCYHMFEIAAHNATIGFNSPIIDLSKDRNELLKKISEKLEFYAKNEFVAKLLE